MTMGPGARRALAIASLTFFVAILAFGVFQSMKPPKPVMACIESGGRWVGGPTRKANRADCEYRRTPRAGIGKAP